MSTQITAENLIAGSDAHNNDVARIKRVVSTLKGLIERELNRDDPQRSFFVWLVGNPDDRIDGHAYGIGLTFYPRTRRWGDGVPNTDESEVVATLKFADNCGRGGDPQNPASYPLDEVKWSPMHEGVPLREHVALIAQNLDRLVVATVENFPEIAQHVRFFCDRGSVIPGVPLAQGIAEDRRDWPLKTQRLAVCMATGTPLRLRLRSRVNLEGNATIHIESATTWHSGIEFTCAVTFHREKGEEVDEIVDRGLKLVVLYKDGPSSKFFRQDDSPAYTILGSMVP
ncbi:hypothetical protein HQ524_03630 [Candidatus Uhrbacteria bacterium]|nr:hypothetical protein [Candidatus Uhrbacteria bacterium]